jgi:hypothetical protein
MYNTSNQQMYTKMRVSTLKKLNEPMIYRNIMKFKVTILFMELFYLKVEC